MQDNKLYLQGAAPSEAIKNAVWNKIKEINPACDDITADITIDSSLRQPEPANVSVTLTPSVREIHYLRSQSSSMEIRTIICGFSKPTRTG